VESRPNDEEADDQKMGTASEIATSTELSLQQRNPSIPEGGIAMQSRDYGERAAPVSCPHGKPDLYYLGHGR